MIKYEEVGDITVVVLNYEPCCEEDKLRPILQLEQDDDVIEVPLDQLDNLIAAMQRVIK